MMEQKSQGSKMNRPRKRALSKKEQLQAPKAVRTGQLGAAIDKALLAAEGQGEDVHGGGGEIECREETREGWSCHLWRPKEAKDGDGQNRATDDGPCAAAGNVSSVAEASIETAALPRRRVKSDVNRKEEAETGPNSKEAKATTLVAATVAMVLK